MNRLGKVFTKIFRGDTIIWIVFFMLSIFSVIELYSASSTLAYKAARHTMPILRHTTFLLSGMVLVFFVHLFPTKYFKLLAYLGLIISIVLLVFVLLKGSETNDAKRWIRLFGIGFQPSDIAKVSLIIFVADYIAKIKENPLLEKKYFYQMIGVVVIIVGLIFFENFSTSAILGTTIFAMMWIGQIHWKKLLSIIGIIAFILFILFIMVKTIPKESMPKALDRAYTWVARVENKANENEESRYKINDDNRQVQHGRIAVARGGLFGVFPGNSVERDYLSHAYDDFIFAIIIEEMGLLGGVFIMFLYLVLLFRTGRIAKVANSIFSAILVTGLGMLVALQAVVNMLVGSGFGLVTGQPLPLISRGGTSILATCFIFGIILGIARETYKANRLKEPNDTKLEVENLNKATVNLEDI